MYIYCYYFHDHAHKPVYLHNYAHKPVYFHDHVHKAVYLHDHAHKPVYLHDHAHKPLLLQGGEIFQQVQNAVLNTCFFLGGIVGGNGVQGLVDLQNCQRSSLGAAWLQDKVRHAGKVSCFLLSTTTRVASGQSTPYWQSPVCCQASRQSTPYWQVSCLLPGIKTSCQWADRLWLAQHYCKACRQTALPEY